jgi:hypothetical protein
MVNAPEAAEDAVVVKPDRADVDEREQVARIERPLVPKAIRKAALPASGIKLEDEEGDRDGHDGVAERLHATCGEAVGPWPVDLLDYAPIIASGPAGRSTVMVRSLSMMGGRHVFGLRRVAGRAELAVTQMRLS